MSDDVDLAAIERRHEPTPEFEARLRARLEAEVGAATPEGVASPRPNPVALLEVSARDSAGTGLRRKRLLWSSVAAVATLLAVVSGLLVLRDRDASTRQQTGPTPATPDEYSPVVLRQDGTLVARRPDGREQVIGRVPPSVLESPQIHSNFVHADVSSTGWVAVTGTVSEGFWLLDLMDSTRPPRFVAVNGPSGGHQSRGTWNPAGTLFAAVERDRFAVIIDPETGGLTHLANVDPPVGYPPTWAADGSGILTGSAEPECAPFDQRPDPRLARRFTMAPIDGGPVRTVIPELADGLNRVYESGLWAIDNRCRNDVRTAQVASVAVVGSTADTWVAPGDVPAAIRQSAFASTRRSLWVVSIGPTHLYLHEASAPAVATNGGPGTTQVRQVNQVITRADGNPSFGLVGVAPDDSSVAVQSSGASEVEAPFRIMSRTPVGIVYLLPTDGSRPATVNGEFAGFVPVSLLDRLPAL